LPITYKQGDVYLLTLNNEALEQWTESEVGGLNTKNFVVPELIRFDTFDDEQPGKKRQIPAFYYKPKSDKPLPVIICTTILCSSLTV
jgi:hypothetical protein